MADCDFDALVALDGRGAKDVLLSLGAVERRLGLLGDFSQAQGLVDPVLEGARRYRILG